jgi:hypothetical protein
VPLVERDAVGVTVRAGSYRLRLTDDRPYALLSDPDGTPWADLCLAWSVHRSDGLDDTAVIDGPAIEEGGGGVRLTIGMRSSLWSGKRLRLDCADDRLSARLELEGRGRITDAHLFGGYYSASGRHGTGFLRSGAGFATVFEPEPGPPERLALPAGRPAAIDVLGGSLPGRGHWFFTPAPFCFGFCRLPTTTGALPPGPWLMAGLATQPGEHHFSGLHYDVEEEGFSLRLAYEGQTTVDGRFRVPDVVFLFGAADPYVGIRAYRDDLAARGLLPGDRAAPLAARPAWWNTPIFCGWGAQAHLAAGTIDGAPDHSRQVRYDGFLASLEDHGLRPGIVVIDDKWQSGYGRNEVDLDKWPDLPGWIARRHDAGQRVLLWLKAWDAEGLPPEQCIRNAAGEPVAVDPTHPGYEATLRAAVHRMLATDGYDADGLKIDFTARTPSGPGLVRHGREWGAELLFRLLATIHDEAKRTKPDALVVTHAPNPYFERVADMIRLNDALRLDDPGSPRAVVPQMRHRAAIVRAACPGVLIDTDDWAMPDLATWREYLAAQPELGVPALYYTTHIDRSGEPLEERDYEALRGLWASFPGRARAT